MNTQLYDCEGNPVALYTNKGNIISSAKRVSKEEYDSHKEEHGECRYVRQDLNYIHPNTDKTMKEKLNRQAEAFKRVVKTINQESNETPKEDFKVNLGDNIDETKLVLGDTPFLNKYIPIEWLEHLVKISPLVESHKENANQLLASQYRQVLTAWRISGTASYPLWKSSVQNIDTHFSPMI